MSCPLSFSSIQLKHLNPAPKSHTKLPSCAGRCRFIVQINKFSVVFQKHASSDKPLSRMADGRLFNTVDHEGSPTNLGLHSWQLQRTHTVDTDLSRGKPQTSTYKSASITFSTHNNYMLQATSVSLQPTGTAPSYSDEYLYVKNMF